jgi:hypothetical protein
MVGSGGHIVRMLEGGKWGGWSKLEGGAAV